MKKWVLVIDVAKCENCNNCFLACKDEHCGNHWPGHSLPQPLHGHRWMNIMRKERGAFPVVDVAYLPKPCMHCDDAPCIKAARDGAVYKREDGIVIIEPKKARGQQHLVSSCPYGAIFWNDQEKVPQKCTLCAHLLDAGWKAPRCVQACPTGALSIHRLTPEELERLKTLRQLSVLGKPANPTQPRVFYENLYRYTKCFIAGSVARQQEDVEDCVPKVPIRLYKEDKMLAQVSTDAFGDFKFDDLPPDSGAYRIRIGDDAGAGEVKTVEVELKQSRSIGVVWL